MLFATLFWAAFSGWWHIHPRVLAEPVSLGGHLSGLTLPVWALLCYVMVLGSFVPYLLSFIALSRLRATPAGIVATTEVIFAFTVAWLCWARRSTHGSWWVRRSSSPGWPSRRPRAGLLRPRSRQPATDPTRRCLVRALRAASSASGG